MQMPAIAFFCRDIGKVNFGLHAAQQPKAMALPWQAVAGKPLLCAAHDVTVDFKGIDNFAKTRPYASVHPRGGQQLVDVFYQGLGIWRAPGDAIG